jgi:hypothetical protein
VEEIKETLNHFKDGLVSEISKCKKLTGKKFKKFADVFGIDDDTVIYYNKFNIIIIDEYSYEQISAYLQEKNRIFRLEFPEYNTYMYVYKYYDDALFDSYFDSSK